MTRYRVDEEFRQALGRVLVPAGSVPAQPITVQAVNPGTTTPHTIYQAATGPSTQPGFQLSALGGVQGTAGAGELWADEADGALELRLLDGVTEVDRKRFEPVTTATVNDNTARIAHRGFINARDAPYGALGNGSTDDTTAIYNASEDARNSGKKLYIPAGVYKLSSSLNNPSNPNELIIEGDGPRITEFTMAAGMILPALSVTGALAAGTAVTAPTSPGDYLVDVSSTAGITAGMYVRLVDATQPIVGLSTRITVSCASEWARVYSVVSGTRLRLHQRLEFGYTTSALVRALTTPVKLDASHFSIRNLTPGTLAATARGIQATFWADLRIRDIDFMNMDASAITLQRGVHGAVESVSFLDTLDLENQLNAPYCISASSCQDLSIQHARSRYGRHLYTAGGDTTYGVASHVYIGDCMAVEHSGTGFDTHPGAIKHIFENCHVHAAFPSQTDGFNPYETSGFQIRGQDTDIVNCSALNVPDSGVYFVYGADRGRVMGGRFSDCATGVLVEDSDDCSIGGGVLIKNPRTDGIMLKRNAAYTAFVSKVTLGDVTITGNPSSAGINNNAGITVNYA